MKPARKHFNESLGRAIKRKAQRWVNICPLLGIAMVGCSGDSEEVTIVVTGSSTVAPLVADAAREYEKAHPGVRVEVQTGGSSRGIADALSGLADLGMVSRDLKAGEEELVAHLLAVDGVCLIVHRDNPVADLSREEVVGIYTGRIGNWKEVGGSDERIVVANKAEGRATLEVFLEYSGLDSADIRADVVVGENQQAIKTVAGNAGAIGYVSVGAASAEAEAGAPIRLVASDGIAPTLESVAKGEFPITRPLQVVSHGELSPEAEAFLKYLKSGEVDGLVKKHLYVPVAR